MKPSKIISGGQTGADMGGLLGAQDCGIPTGGVAPKGYRTERGPQPLLQVLGLTESPYSDYQRRTADNVRQSDGTAIFGNTRSAGSRLTLQLCRHNNKPFIENPDADQLRWFVVNHAISTLNISGNRESGNPGIEEAVRDTVVEAFL